MHFPFLRLKRIKESALSTSIKSIKMLGRVMSVDKDKVNMILLEFQKILKKFRPNTTELKLINSKISKMTAKNIGKQFTQPPTSRSKAVPRSSRPKMEKKWHKINID